MKKDSVDGAVPRRGGGPDGNLPGKHPLARHGILSCLFVRWFMENFLKKVVDKRPSVW